MTAADEAAGLLIDLAYGLALDHGGTTTEGVYADYQPHEVITGVPAGARLVVDDDINSAVYFLTADECRRLGRYLLACAAAA